MRNVVRHSRMALAAATCLLASAAAAVLPWRAVAQDSPQNRISKLEEENAKLRAELDYWKQQQIADNRDQRVIGRQVQLSEARRELESLRAKFTDNHPRVREMKEKIARLERELTTPMEKEPPPDVGRYIESVRIRLLDANVQLQSLLANYAEEHPTVQVAKAKVAALEKELTQVQGTNGKKATSRSTDVQRKLYEEELALAEQQVATIKKRLEVGKGTLDQLLQTTRELYDLKREIALSQSDRLQARQAVEEQIKVVTQQLDETKKRIRNGVQAPEEEIPLQREILRLKREALNYQ